jgi:hypothetical protein
MGEVECGACRQEGGGKGKGAVRPNVVESTKQICTNIYYICSKTQVLGLLGYRVLGNPENGKNLAKPEDFFNNILMPKWVRLESQSMCMWMGALDRSELLMQDDLHLSLMRITSSSLCSENEVGAHGGRWGLPFLSNGVPSAH